MLQRRYQSLVLGNFPIVRGGGAKSLEYAKTLLRNRQHVFIAPEGTRTQREALGRLKPGGALLALELGVTVVPLYRSGLREMRPKGALQPKAGPAGVDVLPILRFAAGTSVEMASAQMQRVLAERHARARTACSDQGASRYSFGRARTGSSSDQSPSSTS